jgi:PEGA domain
MNKALINLGQILSAASLCSCASIVSKTQRPVTITSSPQGAKVTLMKENGVAIQSGETPMTVTLETSAGFFKKAKYKIEASKPGYETASSSVTAGVNGWYWGNIVFGGLIGWLIVDPATGAMWKLEDTYSVNLPQAKKVAVKGGQSVEAVSINDVPLYLRSRMIRVNEPIASR